MDLGSMDPVVPAMPILSSEDIWFDNPSTLVDGDRYTIGWQRWTQKKGGPSFVTLRRSAFGALKLVDRYPLTEEGWTRAFRALLVLEPSTADEARTAIRATRELRRLERSSLAFLTEATFLGGYAAETPLTVNEAYDLRFLEDKLAIFPVRGVDPLVAIPYYELQDVQVGGPGLVRNWSPGRTRVMTTPFGVTDVLAAHGRGTATLKTVLQIQVPDAELFFLDTRSAPDDLRVQLSPGLNVLRQAQAVRQAEALNSARVSIADELSRLATMVDRGILTPDEFDRLKAKLIG
jgi:hypothetical protein